jgi:hypothetical protein
MQIIPLQAIPNQSFSITLDNNLYDIKLITCVNITAASILRNKELILLDSRVEPNMPIIPYRYLEDGNFMILTKGGNYPIYSEFGVTQFLIYTSASELRGIRSVSG